MPFGVGQTRVMTEARTMYLITTANEGSATEGVLVRLLDSAVVSPGVHLICVARGWGVQISGALQARYGPRLTIIDGPADLSLSEARNVALVRLMQMWDGKEALLAFPDDDCWYFAETLAAVRSAFRELGCSAVSGCYGPRLGEVNRRRFPDRPCILTTRRVARHLSSVTLFIRLEAAIKVGAFNPALGAGTPAIAGEDIDYGLRVLQAGLTVAYRPEIVVGHAYGKRGKEPYAAALALVITSHLKRSPELAVLALRATLAAARHAITVRGRGPHSPRPILSRRAVQHVTEARREMDAVWASHRSAYDASKCADSVVGRTERGD
jgi:hypothetical protein